jgi:hypothetical protein
VQCNKKIYIHSVALAQLTEQVAVEAITFIWKSLEQSNVFHKSFVSPDVLRINALMRVTAASFLGLSETSHIPFQCKLNFNVRTRCYYGI